MHVGKAVDSYACQTPDVGAANRENSVNHRQRRR